MQIGASVNQTLRADRQERDAMLFGRDTGVTQPISARCAPEQAVCRKSLGEGADQIACLDRGGVVAQEAFRHGCAADPGS